MQTFAQYALLGSLMAAAVGLVVLATLTLKHGIHRRIPESDDAGTDVPRILRSVRLADTIAVVCFTVAAVLAVVGLTRETRDIASAARIDEGRLIERLELLEQRIAAAEGQLQARAANDQRGTGIERRLGSIEDRVASAERLAREWRDEPSTGLPPRRPPGATSQAPSSAKPLTPVQPSASPRAPRADGTSADPAEVAARPAPRVEWSPVGGPPAEPAADSSVTAASAVGPPSAPAAERPPSTPSTRERTFGEQVANDWKALKRDVQRSGDEWVEGWRRLFRLFGD